MKQLPPGLAAHLDARTTTLAWCWRLTRRDGVRLGFTDHDRDLSFDGTSFEASAGFSASEIRDAVGLSVSNLEVESALSSDHITEGDILAGQYDDARVEIWRVNWTNTEQRVLMRSGSIGEVKRSGLAFTAEVRGLAHYLQQPSGRLFQYGCDADLGDARCSVDLENFTYRGIGSLIDLTSSRSFSVNGLDAYASGWFTRGLLHFTSGANAGSAFEIKHHTAGTTLVTLSLWQEPLSALKPGDAFVATAGCDKHISTCTAKFSNTKNFRGFPHMPGNDFMSSVARSGRLPTRGG